MFSKEHQTGGSVAKHTLTFPVGYLRKIRQNSHRSRTFPEENQKAWTEVLDQVGLERT